VIFEDLYFNELKNYLEPKKNSEENIAIVLGCIADSLLNCQVSAKILSQDLLAIIELNLTQKKSSKKYKDEEVLKNVAYLIGVLFIADVQGMQVYLEACLVLLNNLLPNSADAAKDNIIAAIAKAANSQNLKNFEKNYFLQKILEPILTNIPLKADPRLNANVFSLLENLVNNQNLQYYLDSFVINSDKVFGFVKFVTLNDFVCGIDKVVLGRIKNMLEKLSNESPAFRESFGQLIEKGYANEDERNKFNSVFSNLLDN